MRTPMNGIISAAILFKDKQVSFYYSNNNNLFLPFFIYKDRCLLCVCYIFAIFRALSFSFFFSFFYKNLNFPY